MTRHTKLIHGTPMALGPERRAFGWRLTSTIAAGTLGACAADVSRPYEVLAGRPVSVLTDKAGPPDWSRAYPDGSKDIKYEHIDASIARAVAPRCSATFAISKDGLIQGQVVTGSPQDCIYLRYRLGI